MSPPVPVVRVVVVRPVVGVTTALHPAAPGYHAVQPVVITLTVLVAVVGSQHQHHQPLLHRLVGRLGISFIGEDIKRTNAKKYNANRSLSTQRESLENTVSQYPITSLQTN